MLNFRHLLLVNGAAVGALGLASAATAPPQDATAVPGSWQRHNVKRS